MDGWIGPRMEQTPHYGTIKHLNYENLEEIPDVVLNDSNILVLYLKRNLLKTLSCEIYRMTSLVEINLDSNFISSLPNEFQLLRNLERLNLQNNHLDHIPKAICRLPNIKKLHLQFNSIVTVDKDISNLKTLIHLNLAYNKLTHIPIELFKCYALERLHLENNQLRFIPKQIVWLQELEELTLNDNKLVILPPVTTDMENLIFLDILNNPIVVSYAKHILWEMNYFSSDDFNKFHSISSSFKNELYEIFKLYYNLTLSSFCFSQEKPMMLKELSARMLFQKTRWFCLSAKMEEKLPKCLQYDFNCPTGFCFTCGHLIVCSALYLILDNEKDLKKLYTFCGFPKDEQRINKIGRSLVLFCSISCCKIVKSRLT